MSETKKPGYTGFTRICQRCGRVMTGVSRSTKWCKACRPQAYRKLDQQARQRKRVQAVREQAAAKASSAELTLLVRVADWAGLSYGRLMAKSPAARAALIKQYQAQHR